MKFVRPLHYINPFSPLPPSSEISVSAGPLSAPLLALWKLPRHHPRSLAARKRILLPNRKAFKSSTSLTAALENNIIPASDYPVDIVAIHGLTGGSESTWEFKDGEKRVIWLRDFLPGHLPEARVFSYGYNAEIWNSLGTANFRDYGQELLVNFKGGLQLANQEPEIRRLKPLGMQKLIS